MRYNSLVCVSQNQIQNDEDVPKYHIQSLCSEFNEKLILKSPLSVIMTNVADLILHYSPPYSIYSLVLEEDFYYCGKHLQLPGDPISNPS